MKMLRNCSRPSKERDTFVHWATQFFCWVWYGILVRISLLEPKGPTWEGAGSSSAGSGVRETRALVSLTAKVGAPIATALREVFAVS